MSDERPIEQREMMARILADDAISALWKACEKHPPIHSSHEGYGVLCEEARELSDALNYQGPLMREIQAANRDAIRKELVHVMAMCLRFGIELDSMRVA